MLYTICSMVIDIIIILVLLIFVVVGLKKGLAISLINIFSGTINFLCATLLTKPFRALFETVGLTGAIQNGYSIRMNAMSGFSTNLVTLDAGQLKNHIETTINQSNFSGITKTLTKWFCKISPEQIAGRESVTLTDILSKAYSSFWITLISFAVAFGIIYLVIFLITKIINKAKEDSKLFKHIDRILGVIFGLARGALYVCLVVAVISLFRENGLLGDLIAYLKESKIGGWAYSIINPFVDNYINFDNIINFAHNVAAQ